MSCILGITGGIASGKSTVVKVFEEAGFPIVDGDLVARKIVEPQTPGLAALEEVFGAEILQKDGHLDRKKLGNLIFHNPAKRHLLDETLDSYIRHEINRQIAEKKTKYSLVIVDIPLLYEGHYEKQMDQVAVVYVTPEIQLARLMTRDHLSETEAMERINSQLSLEKKKAWADVVFDNCQNRENTRQQVIGWLKENNFIS